ncbi:MAG: tetratricopeptide repeat protein [Bacteroidia bacterium]|nr:tetratricopeptide repeat protein [Bacteroidia bacterium]
MVNATKTMQEDSVKTQVFFDIAKAYKLEKVDFFNATKFAQKSIDLSNKIQYYSGTVSAMLLIGQTYREQSLYKEAIETFKSAARVCEEHKEKLSDRTLCFNYITAHTLTADMYVVLRDFPNAENSAFKALELAEKYNMQKGKCWMALGNIFSEQKNIAEAKKYTLKALEDFKQQKRENSDVARAYAFLARYYFEESDFENAIATYLLSYETYKKLNNVYGIRVTLYNLAEISIKIKEYDKAENYLAEILNNTNAAKDALQLSFINKLKFRLTLQKKNYKEALTICKEILDYAVKEKNIVDIKAAYEKYYQVYTATKDTINAYLTIEKISALKDSIYNTSIAKNTAELVKKYETEKKEQQISFLDKENKLNKERLDKETQLGLLLKSENLLKESKLQQELLLKEALERENALQNVELEQKQTIQQGLERENKLKNTELNKETELNKTLQTQNGLMLENSKYETIIRWLMIAALLGFLVLGINYYRNYRRQISDNFQITKQAEELKILMKELHHRVKNNLQLIMAMLRMQQRTIEDKAAIDALVNSENRLYAIAMVHEKLYKTENISSVLVKDYLQELIDVLAKQYNNTSKPIQFKIIDNTSFSAKLETAIPIGLIVNELVANSLKYAFHDLDKGEICIELIYINKKYQLSIKDNGPGLPKGQLPDNAKTLGLRLVKLFTAQLTATLHYETNNGACFIISFS